MREEWRPTPYEGYEVSNLGRVRGKYLRGGNRILLAQCPTRNGRYLRVNMYLGNGRVRAQVHHLVCLAFHGPKPSDSHIVAHWDDNPRNNRAENLRWATHKENQQDADRNLGYRGPSPERSGTAKLTWDAVRDIRSRHAQGTPQVALAREYGVSKVTVCNVVKGKVWRE